jgi:SHS2 domain-containing protein
MGYRFLDDVAIADVAFEAWGKTLRELFISAADATMNVMVENLSAIDPKEKVEFTVEANAVDMLLFKFLQEFVFYKDARYLLLRASEVKVQHQGDKWRVHTQMYGEEIQPEKHKLGVDVKAVTLHHFRVEKKKRWEAFVILDI